MNPIVGSKISVPQTFKTYTRRLLSERPRNRKWKLPQVSPSPSTSSQSEATKKKSIRSRERSALMTVLSSSQSQFPSTWPPKNSARRKTALENWVIQKTALKRKFPGGWRPGRKLSPDAMDGIRILQRQVSCLKLLFYDEPQGPQFTIFQLAAFFKMSPEAIRRILRSRWRPSAQEQADRVRRWKRRSQEKAKTTISIHSFRERSATLHRYRLENFSRKLYHTRKDNVIQGESSRAWIKSTRANK